VLCVSHRRLAFIQGWITNGTPSVFWISGLFFPQAFLTGSLQNFARRHRRPIDTVEFTFRVLRAPHDITALPPPDDGVYVRGLHLEGARWDDEAQVLTEPRAKELYSPLPILWLKPEVKPSADEPESNVSPNPKMYRCPVYKTLTRQGAPRCLTRCGDERLRC
jgi:dynein heavy chain